MLKHSSEIFSIYKSLLMKGYFYNVINKHEGAILNFFVRYVKMFEDCWDPRIKKIQYLNQ